MSTDSGWIDPRKWPQERVDRVAEMLLDGLSSGQIGEAIGVSRNAVIGYVRRHPQLKAIGFKRESGKRDPSLAKPRGPDRQPRTRKVKLSKIAGVLAAPKAKGIHVAAVAAKREARASDPGTANLVRVTAHAATFDAGTRKVRLEDLKADECRFPIGDTREDGFGFCGERRLDGYPYCIHHCRRAYQNFVCREAVAA